MNVRQTERNPKSLKGLKVSLGNWFQNLSLSAVTETYELCSFTTMAVFAQQHFAVKINLNVLTPLECRCFISIIRK